MGKLWRSYEKQKDIDWIASSIISPSEIFIYLRISLLFTNDTRYRLY